MSNEIGTLVVIALRARNLNDKHTLYKQDPYAKLSLNDVTEQTEIDKRGGQHPTWDAGIE
jgi:Ca2+-dependent lipid-binding protein